MPEPLTLSAFFSAWDLFSAPTLAGALAGLLLGWLGVYIVLRHMVFVSAALSQTAGFGVAAAFYVQIHWGISSSIASPVAGALVATAVVALLLTLPGDRRRARKDGLLGLAYLTGTAGTLVVGTRIVQEVQDIDSILLGSAVAVRPESFRLMVATTLSVLGLHIWWMRGFLQASFDRDGAVVRGLPVRLLDITLFASIATAISVATRILGALPVFAFSVLPAMAAIRLAVNTPRALALAALLGGLSGFLGYVVAFLYELPVGPTQTLVAGGFVVIAAVIERLRR